MMEPNVYGGATLAVALTDAAFSLLPDLISKIMGVALSLRADARPDPPSNIVWFY